MPLADYVHLRTHSAYSLSAGAIKIKELVKLCRANSMPAVAITDTGNLFGALEFANVLHRFRHPADHRHRDCARRRRDPERAARTPRPGNGSAAEPDRIVLLVQSETGYRNLIGLTSRAYLEGEAGAEPSIALADLGAANEGLICLAGGAGGPIGRLVAEGQADAAEAVLLALKRRFRAASISNCSGTACLRRRAAKRVWSISPLRMMCRWSRPTTPTSPTATSTRRTTRCCASRRAASSPTPDRRRLTPDHYFRPAAEMRMLFADLPEACDNTLVIARRCAFIPQLAQADPAGLQRAGQRAGL